MCSGSPSTRSPAGCRTRRGGTAHATVAGGRPTATVEVGGRADATTGWVGPYIGETLGRARSIVHFDPLLAAARNRPTAVAITGEPGGGKAKLAMRLIYQLALPRAKGAVVEP